MRRRAAAAVLCVVFTACAPTEPEQQSDVPQSTDAPAGALGGRLP